MKTEIEIVNDELILWVENCPSDDSMNRIRITQEEIKENPKQFILLMKFIMQNLPRCVMHGKKCIH